MVRPVIALLLLWAARVPAATLALAGGTLYPAPGERPIANAVILVQGSRVIAAGPHASIRIPKNAEVLDCSRKYVMAGFWNNHVHIFTPVLLHAREASAAELNAELEKMLNRWGFTTVFDIASVLDNTIALRRRIDTGELRGPRILTVGEPLWTVPPVYVRDYLEANHIRMPVVTTPEECAARVGALAWAGADGIKLFTGSVQGHGKVANMPLEMVRAATAEAHRRHLPVFAHPQNSAGIEAALQGGVDILAHTAPDSPPWTQEFVARLTVAHMALVPTLTLFDFEARKGNDSEQERRQWIDKMVAELRAFQEGGGEVLFGTDVGYTDHYDTMLEFTLMSCAGMTFEQILASLTTNPARRFGYAAHRGRVAAGMDADMVVLDSDPKQDITALSKVCVTVVGGRITYSTRK